MYVNVLGPLTLRHGTHSGVPTAMKPRKVLSLLLLNDGRVVPVPALMAELWGDEPPRTGLTTLQTYILHLRKLLAQVLGVPTATVARDVLQTRPGGYAFALRSGQLDVHRYRDLVTQGECALDAGDERTADAAFRRALAVWQGPALVDVAHGRPLQAEVARLEQSRLTVTERSIETRLRLGRHQEALSELASLVVEHRFHEGMHGQYMLALHRAGQRTRALAVYQRLRLTMAEELGLEPSLRLQRLQQAVLASDPRLDVETGAAGRGPVVA
ncbi:AfsR/SARP family transcriptional regulator [Streptomyces sp. XD-27]|uniref:AfsR/SARP family transcriptional regulator n=1 Tax=Streptomyces sp. XD-27 TaxID=3062779 RepID=UPI0026F40E5E|nr:AfsR/SARP family transcriptional regulator [Streptomyces sp. XD-27]WKX72545.1 AfsR/SARP family transcriptional regulator [Streptomyces sp. XD-27]